jgi:hypothetical protein
MPDVISHQTVRLSRGRHISPQQGACVMELASMLADEPFSDHPRAVCPLIAAFLRRYNDSLDDDRRQELVEIAALVVGSVGPAGTLERRAGRCREQLAELRDLPRPPRRWRLHRRSWLGDACARAYAGGDHDAALRFVCELVAIGIEDRPDRAAVEARAEAVAAGCLPPSRSAG